MQAASHTLVKPLPMSFIAGLRCTVCRSADLDFATDVITCRRCGQECPVLGGVPVMFDTVSVQDGAAVDELSARQVLAVFELQDDPVSVLRIRTMMRKQVRFGGSLIQVESRQFLDRVRNSGHDIASDAPGGGASHAQAPADLAIVPRYAWSKNYVPRRVRAATELLANMRLENRGDVTLSRAGGQSGAGRAMIAQRWQQRDGTAVATPDLRTPLPIDLHPGQAVTVAVRLMPPARTGSYLLALTLVQEQVRWLDDDALAMVVSVEHEVPGPVPEGWHVLAKGPDDYDADHRRGRDMLAAWFAGHPAGSSRTRPRVLEVGGNVYPMCAGMDAELVNVDVDLLGLQVGRMVAARRGLTMDLVCADAFNLPFANGYFDAIVIFASLHHFPDPAALLEQLRWKLRPGGFIGLLCEPVGHIWPGAILAPFLAELERGVNEQSFSLREYELMFRQADLAPAEVVVDFDSLKARLVHAAPDDASGPDRA